MLALGVVAASAKSPYEKARDELRAAKTDEERFYFLGVAAKEAFKAGDYREAGDYARQLEALTPKFRSNWNYGNAIQDYHLVLGRLAVRDGKIGEAKTYLLAAGAGPGSPQMDTFGPNLSLAKDLLGQGETEVVLQYFEMCRRFWKMHRSRLDQWKAEVEAGKTPDFGANLLY